MLNVESLGTVCSYVSSVHLGPRLYPYRSNDTPYPEAQTSFSVPDILLVLYHGVCVISVSGEH